MRAVGLVRQSKGREDSLSPAEQRGRIGEVAEREGLEIVATHEEIDVSGGSPLAERAGLRAAVEAIEAGEAEVVVVAYFDRLFRSIAVQAEVVGRVEAAGGRILAADVGAVSEASAGEWMSGAMLGVVSEYYRRSVRERSGRAQRIAVEEGRIVYPTPPLGYEVQDGRLVPGPDAPVVAQAFAMRAEGQSIGVIREHLRSHGIERSFSTIQRLLASRAVLGELHFGELVNVGAHEAIVSRDVWDAAQRVRVPRGPRPSSDRLLARLGVLRCGSCGSRMVVGFRTAGEVKGRPRYDFYRCPPVGDCTRRVTIGAEKVEQAIVDRLKVVLADAEGRASTDTEAAAAEAEAARDQAALDSAIRSLSGMEDEPASVETLRDLRERRDRSRDRAGHLGGLRSALRLTIEDFDTLTRTGQRDLIRAAFAGVYVAPGRGADRLTFKLAGEA